MGFQLTLVIVLMGCGKTVLCKITVISAINVGKTESETDTLQSSPPIYHLPFCPLLLVFLSLCGRISPDLLTYFLCVSCFFPLLVFLTRSLFVYTWSLCVCLTDCCWSSCTLQIHHLSAPALPDLYFSIHQIFQTCQHTSYAMANLQVQELFVLVEIQLVLFSASGSLLPLLPPQFTLPTVCHSTASQPP